MDLNFKKAMSVSLALHLLVLGGGWALLHVQLPRYQKQEWLVVEIDGTLSHRQKEEAVLRQAQAQNSGAPQQKQTPAPPPPQVQKVEKKEQQKKQEKEKQEAPKTGDVPTLRQAKSEKAKAHEVPKEVERQARETPKKHVAESVPMPPPKNKISPQTPRENEAASNRQSRQETIKHEKVDVSVLKRYLARLKKALQPHIVYPDAAKNLQYFGNPAVRFSVDADGHVDPGSVSVVKSSKHAVLDEYAMKAILASSPLPKPPKPLTLQVEVAFSVK